MAARKRSSFDPLCSRTTTTTSETTDRDEDLRQTGADESKTEENNNQSAVKITTNPFSYSTFADSDQSASPLKTGGGSSLGPGPVGPPPPVSGCGFWNKDFSSTSPVNNQHHDQERSSICRLTDHDHQNHDHSSLSSDHSHPVNWHLYRGIIYSSLSSLFFSLSSVIVKLLKDIHPGELAVFRFIGILLLSVPLVALHNENPLGPEGLRHYLVLRGLAGATSLFLRFFAFRYLPLADASVIIFSVPVFVSIFGRIFLKEPCGAFQTASVAATMIGLCMTTKLFSIGNIADRSSAVGPDRVLLMQNMSQTENFTTGGLMSTAVPVEGELPMTPFEEHLLGVSAALCSTLFGAAVYIVIRRAKSAHHSVIMFNFGWVALLETTALTSALDGWTLPRGPSQWCLVTLLGILSFSGQWLLTRSLQLEQAGPVSVVRAAADIVLAFLWQIWIFDQIPDGWSICGAALVTSCIVATGLRKWLLSLPDGHKAKMRLYLLTT